MARGKGNREGAQGIMVNAGFMLLLSGAVLTVLGIAFHRPLLHLFGASEVTYPYASSYIVIYLIGTLCVMLSLGLNPYINCQGFARTGMLTVALGAAANIVLDRAVAVSVCCMGCQVFNRQKSRVKAGFPRFPSGPAVYSAHYRARHRQLCHVVYGYARAGGVQCYSTQFRRRPLHQRHDCT